ncbi:MAG: ABC transporter substrate-binding protein [Solirubrobacterales bacterium]|nr:ABC transporter substrate-binding protein [Solirubrobacterales bacterium]
MKSSLRLPAVLAALIGLFGAAALISGCGDSEPDWSGKTIKLGSVFSTTGDGVAFGPQQVKAARLAVQEINADSDGVNGARIELIQRNDRSVPARSAKLMRKLIEGDQTVAVLGPTFSNSAAVADPVANRLGTPVLAVSNTGPGIVGDCPYPCEFIFRDSLGEAEAIPANVKNLVGSSKAKSAVIVHPKGDPFGSSTAAIARDAFTEEGVKVIANTVTSAGIQLALRAKPDVFMITASSGEVAAGLIKELRELGFDGPIAGGNAFNSQLAARNAGPDGKGAQSASAWFAGNDSEVNREFIAAYDDAYGTAPDQFAAQAYTGVKLLAEAAEDADLGFEDPVADRNALRNSLEGVEEETPLGNFSFTSDHDVRQPIWIVAMNGKGGYTLVEEVKPE